MIIKNEIPILEYSTDRVAVINPRPSKTEPFPGLCLITFFAEVLEGIVEKYGGVEVGAYQSEMRDFPVYKMEYKGETICICQAVVGSGSIAMMTDYLIGKGVETIVCCGSCGVLDEIPAGHVIIPIKAMRDEGGSYQYLAPSRYVELQETPIQVFRETLKELGIAYIETMTWTTDGFYRETKEMVAYRREEGCQVVEMECATMAAVAQFRGVTFGQLLYSGDILVGDGEYDDRGWYDNLTARERLFYAAIESLVKM